MTNHHAKVAVSMVVFLGLVIGIPVLRAMVPPRAELVAYMATLPFLTNEELLGKYHKDFAFLQASPRAYSQVPSKPILETEERIVQLPIFKVPLFKATVKELKKRKLMSADEIKRAERLIKEKEGMLKAAASTSVRFPKQARYPYLSMEFYKDSLAKMSPTEIIRQIKRLESMPKNIDDRDMMLDIARQELSKQSKDKRTK